MVPCPAVAWSSPRTIPTVTGSCTCAISSSSPPTPVPTWRWSCHRGVLASEQWRLNLEPLQERMHVHEVEAVELGTLAEATRALRAEHTVVPDGDYLAMRLGALRRWKGTGTLSVLLIRDPADESPTTWKRRLELGCKSALFWQARRRAGVHIVGLRSALAEPRAGRGRGARTARGLRRRRRREAPA